MLSEVIKELCDINKEKKCKEISEIIYELGQVKNNICGVMVSNLLTDEEKTIILKSRLKEDIDCFIESNELDIELSM